MLVFLRNYSLIKVAVFFPQARKNNFASLLNKTPAPVDVPVSIYRNFEISNGADALGNYSVLSPANQVKTIVYEGENGVKG